jgi:ParB-like chromosome segregation protein Spo0J
VRRLQRGKQQPQQSVIAVFSNCSSSEDKCSCLQLRVNEESASLTPLMSDLEYESLKSSIHEHGQLFPIVVNQDGVILDGHQRNKACQELGIKPSVLVKQFENRLQEKKFIIEVNRSRRHLNEFQRCELQIKLESIESELEERMSDPGKMGAEK